MKHQRIFIILFLIIIYGVLGFYGFKQFMLSTGRSSLELTDNWKYYTFKDENNIVDKIDNKIGSFKTTIENKTNNYFPLYLNVNSFYKEVNFNLNYLTYNNVPIGTNSDGERLFYNTLDNFFYLENKYTSSELDERYDQQVDFINTMDEKGLDINIYMPTRYELTSLSNSDVSKYVDAFKKDINSDINLTIMDVNDIDDYKNKFYTTDHHWNMNGALDAYYDIMEMLDKKPIDSLSVNKLVDTKCYGSMAKTGMNTTKYDNIIDVDYYPNYDVTVNGIKNLDRYKPRKLQSFDTKFHDCYADYFYGLYYEVVFDYHNEEDDNLLILGDSYAWSIDYLIAASYNKTYELNLRYLDDELDLQKYMEEHDIDTVLFLYEGQSLLFDVYDYGFIRKVK